MSKWIEKKTPPVLPIYFAALVWLVGGIVLPLYRLWALALTALLKKPLKLDVIGRAAVPQAGAAHRTALHDRQRGRRRHAHLGAGPSGQPAPAE